MDAERSVAIDSPLGGQANRDGFDDGVALCQRHLGAPALPLEAQPKLDLGPNWRSKKAPADAMGRLTALASDRFLASDGGRGLTHWQWSARPNYVPLPKDKDPDKPTLELKEGSLTADPVLLPEVKDKPRQVCIADVTGALSLVTVEADGRLKPGTRWKLGDQIKVMAGPFIEVTPGGAMRIACVIDNHRLIWLDPEKPSILWSYRGNPRTGLVGRPQLVGGMVVVADDAGLIVGLDPDKGNVVGNRSSCPAARRRPPARWHSATTGSLCRSATARCCCRR